MRVLLTSWGWSSHYYPLVPLGWQLRVAGHEVRVATQPCLASTVRASGLPAVETGHDVDFAAEIAASIARTRELLGPGFDQDAALRTNMRRPLEFVRETRALAARPGPPYWVKLYGAAMVCGLRPFVTLAKAMVDELIEFVRAWQPDVIIFEPTTYAAPIAAATVGVPAVRHLWGVDVTHAYHDFEPEAFAELYGRLGLSAVDTCGELTIDPCPPSMQIPGDYPRHVVRYIPYNGPGTHPAWLTSEPATARVGVTWGNTVGSLTAEKFPTSLAPQVVRAVAECGVDVVAAVSEADHDATRTASPRARVVRQLPLHILLPTCDALIHQGGGGTMMTALSKGVPQVVVPQAEDHALNACQLARVGAGVGIERGEATPDALACYVRKVLDDDGFAAAARGIQAEMAAQPPLVDAVAAVERLAASALPAATVA